MEVPRRSSIPVHPKEFPTWQGGCFICRSQVKEQKTTRNTGKADEKGELRVIGSRTHNERIRSS